MIDQFIHKLSARKSSFDICNPYEDQDVANNLRVYLEYMRNNNSGILLVGEAPGYKGCRITGIPFTSGEIIRSEKHAIFQTIGEKIHLKKEEKENTAKIVWDYLEGRSVLPLFWNSFPFHPHPGTNRNKNRQPNSGEMNEGISYLRDLIDIFKPRTVAGIGRFGTRCAQKALHGATVEYIRHPSYGGKKEFINGMRNLI